MTLRLRKARIGDAPRIQELIFTYAQQGLMLPRPLNEIYETLRDYTVALDGDLVVGTGALHIVWDNLAEIRAVAVEPAYARRGIGSLLVNSLIAECRDLQVGRLFLLTYQPEFFKRFGFTEVPKEELPQKVWKDCIHCPKFPKCDEVALFMRLG